MRQIKYAEDATGLKPGGASAKGATMANKDMTPDRLLARVVEHFREDTPLKALLRGVGLLRVRVDVEMLPPPKTKTVGDAWQAVGDDLRWVYSR